MHAAAAPSAVALFLAEEFRNRSIDMLFESVSEETVPVLGLRPRNSGSEVIGRHRPDRGEALGDGVAVAPVGAGDVVVGAERAAGTDGRGFLADRDVGWAAVVVSRQGIVAARAEADDHLLQLADGQHVVEQVEGRRAGEPLRGDLGAGVAGEIKAVDRTQRLLERREVRSSVAPVGRVRDHCVHLWL